jgi:hypothetical protein
LLSHHLISFVIESLKERVRLDIVLTIMTEVAQQMMMEGQQHAAQEDEEMEVRN